MVSPLSILLTQVLPFWAERAFDPQHGGYFTELTPEGHPVAEESRLCLVQTRMLYTFSHAYCLSSESWAFTAAERALDFMTRRLRRPDGAFAAMASLGEGTSQADLVDFYDQAFVLFSLAWWYRASHDPAALRMAHAAMAALDLNLKDPVYGGWQEANIEQAPRRQNPHMHLLEAMLAWYEVTEDEAWIVPVREILSLFRERFFDAPTGTLREFLGPDLSPVPDQAGQIREPGHHFEWVWLLYHYRRLINEEDVTGMAERLYETARRHGVDREGLVVEAIDPHGATLESGRLLWPQTEAVKAAIARTEFLNADPAEADAFLVAMMRTHFPSSGPLWINHVSSQGEPLSRNVPTRLLYHLTLCVAEYARLRGAIMPNVFTAH
ncbi:AGE family epimerase/isomerase [Microvirga sp. HBU67558]|uniref:AGE family epimerase/isomerase n=1 Tax=Microvirga TaxID=186650 RepID=UPI001B36F624|nr:MULTISPECIES: AGE family epimerase/isomerase [unclassified Microvirga]MBQ0820694.1 AGE family epimerase/isomerase [Microvirga sp. HBU67558]